MIAFFLFRVAISFGLRSITPTDQPGNLPGDSSKTLNVREHFDLSDCACDVSNQCDKDCCCDPDCPGYDPQTGLNNISKNCLPGLPNIPNSEKKATRKCEDDSIPGSGSLLDWVQRTMLCVYRDNNPSTGKYYELNEKSSTNNFAETQSSLFGSFTEPEDKTLKPLISHIPIQSIYLLDENKTLGDYLQNICNSSLKINHETCFNETENPDKEQCLKDLNLSYDYNSIRGKTIIYQENIDLHYTCDDNKPEQNITNSSITLYDIKCTSQLECSANINVSTLESNFSQIFVSYRWPFADGTTPPRGYYFSEIVKVDENQSAEIEAPLNGNVISDNNINKVPLRFGMNVDFTYMTEMDIFNCSLINNSMSADNCYFFGFDQDTGNYTLNVSNINLSFDKILKVPYPEDNNSDNFIVIEPAPPVSLNDSIIYNEDTNETIPSLYMTGIERSIDIFYKTVGYENNPTHIIMSMNVKYDYSTSIMYLNTDYFRDYRKITLRTVVRYFEYPNNINMFKGISTNTKLQSWLPFDV